MSSNLNSSSAAAKQINHCPNYKWRLSSKIISLIDLVFGMLSILAVIVVVPLVIYFYVNKNNYDLDEDLGKEFDQLLEFIQYEYLVVIIDLLIWLTTSVVQIWSGNVLRNATTVKSANDKSNNRGEKECIFWRNVAATLLLINFVINVVDFYNEWLFWLWVSFKVAFILVVQLYIGEIKAGMATLDIVNILSGLPFTILLYIIRNNEYLYENMRPEFQESTKFLDHHWMIISGLFLALSVKIFHIWFANILRKATGTELMKFGTTLKRNVNFGGISAFFILMKLANGKMGSNDSTFWSWIYYRVGCIVIVEYHLQEIEGDA